MTSNIRKKRLNLSKWSNAQTKNMSHCSYSSELGVIPGWFNSEDLVFLSEMLPNYLCSGLIGFNSSYKHFFFNIYFNTDIFFNVCACNNGEFSHLRRLGFAFMCIEAKMGPSFSFCTTWNDLLARWCVS